MSRESTLIAKRNAAAAKIKEVAPHIHMLVGMLDETKIDLILIALAGATLPEQGESRNG